MINKKYSLVGGVVALVIVASFFVFYQNKHVKSVSQQSGNNTIQVSTTTSTPNQASSTPPNSTTAPKPKKLSYGDAIKAYPYRYQFSHCSANPGTMSVKKNSPVMLDNRDATAHTLKVDGQSIKVAGYDYQLLYPKHEGTFQMTCNGGGSAVLNVEN